MTVEADVLAAKTPRDALLVLARAVDALQTPVDPWAQWEPRAEASTDADAASGQLGSTRPDGSTPPHEVTNRPDRVSDEAVVAWIAKNYGQVPADDSEGRAIVAMVRRDLERAGKSETPPQDFSLDADGILHSRIDFSPRDDKHRAARYAFARDHLKLDVAFGDHPTGGDWAADYAQTGPMPIYINNWEMIKQYPDNVKAAMVADVESYDVKMSQEMGADLLKQPMQKDEHNPAGRISPADDA